jgi:hypothetical protein
MGADEMEQRKSLRVVAAVVLVFLSLVSCSLRKRSHSQSKTERLLKAGKIITGVETIPGSSTLRGEVVGVVDAPPERVWKVIRDYNEHKHFMPNILECFVVRPEGLKLVKGIDPAQLRSLESKLKEFRTDDVTGEVLYLYGLGDFPWPIANKAYILKVVRDPHRYQTHAAMVIGQMKINESSWELRPYGKDGSKTLAKYRILLDPGVPAPGFAVKMAADSSLPAIIKAVRERVKDPAYSGP